MSLATRCTHCGTIFKIVQDQLKVSEGWVRCGRCNEVFNALPTLFDLETEAPPPRPAAARPPEPAAPSIEPPQSVAPPPEVEPPQTTEDDLPVDTSPVVAATDFDLDTSVGFSTPIAPPVDAPPPPAWQPPAEDLPATDEADALDSRYLMPSDRERLVSPRRPRARAPEGPEFADAVFPEDAMAEAEQEWASDFGHSQPAEPQQPLAPMARSPLAPPELPPTPTPVAAPAAAEPIAVPLMSSREKAKAADKAADTFEPEQALPPPSQRKGKSGTRGRVPPQETPEFLRRAQRQAFWRNPSTRGVLFGMAIALVLALVMQVAHQFRDLLAAYYPDSRPAFAWWCETMGCKMAPPLRLEDLQVDNVTLVRANSEGPDRYRLAVVVHNRAPIDIAWPHVDLSLTDANGILIARRVFSPVDAQWLDTADAAANDDKAASAATAASRPAAAPGDKSTTLVWNLRTRNLQPAGYTAELFYP